MTAGEPAISQLRELPLARLARERGVYLSFNNGRDTEYCIRAHLEPTQLRDWQREVRAQTQALMHARTHQFPLRHQTLGRIPSVSVVLCAVQCVVFCVVLCVVLCC